MIEYVEIESRKTKLRGMVHYGQGQNCIPVVIVHGYFSANRVGPQRLFFEMANLISKSNYDVYRFDLTGMGESDGNISDITFDDHVEDVKNILEYVRKIKGNVRVCTISHCLGCNITLANVIKHSDWFREIVFLAPYYTTPEIMSSFFNDDQKEQLISESYTYRKGLYAHSSFFERSKQDDFMNMLRRTPVTLNVIIPENDQFIPFESNKYTFQSFRKINLTYIPFSDHNFLTTKKEVIDKVMEVLRDEYYTE